MHQIEKKADSLDKSKSEIVREILRDRLLDQNSETIDLENYISD